MNDLYPPIGDYALIGDCRSAALVSRGGSIDWLCMPRFDSPSIFGALLDAGKGGRFRVRPSGSFQATRRYVLDSNVVETTFTTAQGRCLLRDLMPVASEEAKRRVLTADHEVLRQIRGLEGQVELEITYEPRPHYGKPGPELRHHGGMGLWGEAQGGAISLLSDMPLELAPDSRSAHGLYTVHAGEARYLSFTYNREAPAVVPALGASAQARIDQSVRWWQAWAARCRYVGPYREMVVRSALALKLLTYAPSGAVVAAATTSLPELAGGVRNWDYRYSWLRDASFTVRALFTVGYGEEAEAFLSWILDCTRLTWPELQVLYDVFGEARLRERELPHLDGYKGSRPVRIGNDAHNQLQLDVYGEVIDAFAHCERRGSTFDKETAHFLASLGHTVCKRWLDPDEGIWEARSGRSRHTHSLVLCWVALDRLIHIHETGKINVPVEQLRATRDAIRDTVESHGYNEQLGSYTRELDGYELDASLLVLPLYGYISADHPRMRSTCQRIHERLGQGSLIYRYEAATDDGLPKGENAFGICSFWAVECRALGGDVAGATRAFEELLTYANDVGLYAEEIDPETGSAFGNFPQAFTHVGLINAALTLAECRAEIALLESAPHTPDLMLRDRQ